MPSAAAVTQPSVSATHEETVVLYATDIPALTSDQTLLPKKVTSRNITCPKEAIEFTEYPQIDQPFCPQGKIGV